MDLDEFIAGTQETFQYRENIQLWIEAAIDRVTQLWDMEGWAEATVGQYDDGGNLYKIGVQKDKLWIQVFDSDGSNLKTEMLADLSEKGEYDDQI